MRIKFDVDELYPFYIPDKDGRFELDFDDDFVIEFLRVFTKFLEMQTVVEDKIKEKYGEVYK